MKTILIQGGTDGMGRALADDFLKKGNEVIIVGYSQEKGKQFLQFAKQHNATKRATFIQADLSLVSENERVINEVAAKVNKLDKVFFFAANQGFRKEPNKTKDGFEHTFALYYISRFILSYGLAPLLEKSDEPIVFNVSAPGMKGNIQWDNLQLFHSFESFKAMRNGSRLNDLLAVKFAKTHSSIRTILYNPWLVRTTGSSVAFGNRMLKAFMAIMYKFKGKTVEEAILPIIQLVEQPFSQGLTAYIKGKPIDLSMDTYNPLNADRLHEATLKLLSQKVKHDYERK